MDTFDQKNRKPDRKRSSLFSSTPFFLFLGLAGLAIVFFLWHQSTLDDATQDAEQKKEPLVSEIAIPEQTTPQRPLEIDATEQRDALEQRSPTRPQHLTESKAGEEGVITPTPSELQSLDDFLGSAPTTAPFNEKLPPITDKSLTDRELHQQMERPLTEMCKASAKVVGDFFQHLDSLEYLQEFQLNPNSETYFSTLIQKLLDNPPIVSGETNDLFTILQNTAHFFRIIGNENIKILKTILSNENERFEEVLAHYYMIINESRCAQEYFDITVPENALYEYGGFFLNTMGGRLYLFRRDSVSRMVISYYSILLIDKANKTSANTHGIEIATSIDLLVDEMESTTKELRLRDNYLTVLYALQEEYQ